MYPDIFKKCNSELVSTIPIATMIDAYLCVPQGHNPIVYT